MAILTIIFLTGAFDEAVAEWRVTQKLNAPPPIEETEPSGKFVNMYLEICCDCLFIPTISDVDPTLFINLAPSADDMKNKNDFYWGGDCM